MSLRHIFRKKGPSSKLHLCALKARFLRLLFSVHAELDLHEVQFFCSVLTEMFLFLLLL